MTKRYRYRVYGARGAVDETTTYREAKRLAGKWGVIEGLDRFAEAALRRDLTGGRAGPRRRNPLDRRIKGVMKQYGPLVAFYTVEVVLPRRDMPAYFGDWDWDQLTSAMVFKRGPDQLREDLEALQGDELIERAGEFLLAIPVGAIPAGSTPFTEALRWYIDNALATNKWYDNTPLDTREWDRVIPWVALQVQRALKGKLKIRKPRPSRFGRRQETRETLELEILERLHNKMPEVRDWVEATSPNLMKLTPGQVLQRSSRWHAALKRKQKAEAALKHPGKVVYRFADGWTVQELTTKAQLGAEGEAMGQCVGGYCPRVERGESAIYSIRDPKGMSRVTIEVHPPTHRVVQVKGKGNNKIKAKAMCARVLQFISAKGWTDSTYGDLKACKARVAPPRGRP